MAEVGQACLRDVRRACETVEKYLRVEVNPVVIPVEEWQASSPDPFVDQLRSAALVEIPLPPAA